MFVQALDEDSEAEKLSPLLQNTENTNRMNNLALNMADVLESIDDADTDHEETTQLSIPDNRSKSCKFYHCYLLVFFPLTLQLNLLVLLFYLISSSVLIVLV